MTVRSRADTLSLVSAFLAVLMYFAASFDVAAAIPAALGLLAGRAVTGPLGCGRALPTGLISMGVVGAVALVILLAIFGSFDVELFSRMLLILLALKMLDRRRARDAAQIISLSVFLAIGAVLESNAIGAGLLMLAFVPVACAATMAHQVHATAELSAGQGTRIDPGASRLFRRTAAWLSGTAVFGAVVLFLVIPRGLAEQAFGNWGGAALGPSTVGFDDEIDLDTGGLISDSSTPVLDLQVTDLDGRIVGGVGEVFYLRGAVLDEYAARGWKSSGSRQGSSQGLFSPNKPYPLGSSKAGDKNSTFNLHISIRSTAPDRSYIFTAWEPMSIEFKQRTGEIRNDSSQVIRILSGIGGKMEYTVATRDPLKAGDLYLGSASAGVRPPDAVTFDSPAVRAYAAQVLRDSGIDPDPAVRPVLEDQAAARVFEEHLRSGFAYTLSPTAPPADRDPIGWFLTEKREGHCEVFASAMTAMCRSVGIDARVVTGYVATDYNNLSGHYVVRESNAHAWVEVQIQPRWVPAAQVAVWRFFDPTPPSDFRNIHEPDRTLWSRVQDVIETIEFAWITTVVGYGEENQAAVVGKVTLPSWLQRLDTRAEQRVITGGTRAILVSLASGVLAFVGSAILLTLGRTAWLALMARRETVRRPVRARRSGDAVSPATRAVLRELGRLHRAMRRAGRPAPSGVPLGRHIEQSADELGPEGYRAAARAVELVYQHVFGRDELDESQVAELARSVRGVRRVAR